MSETKAPEGRVRTEVYGHVLKIIIDNAAKKNSFSPRMMSQMSDALTLLDSTDDWRVGVICAEGSDFTAGLDMPKFFGPQAEQGGQCRRFRARETLPQTDRHRGPGDRVHDRDRDDAGRRYRDRR